MVNRLDIAVVKTILYFFDILQKRLVTKISKLIFTVYIIFPKIKFTTYLKYFLKILY